MFFEIHDENKVGYKCLTDADLGRKSSTHQTHIGLFDDVLTFFPNNVERDDAMFVYDNQATIMPMSFDRIEMPNGSFRSPKIRTGGRNSVTVVSTIRSIAQSFPNNAKWFLFWFGLKSGQVVFFLFNSTSQTFKDITNMKIILTDTVKGRIEKTNSAYSNFINYLETIINANSEPIQKELEVISQTDPIQAIEKYRKYDIEKANSVFKNIGQQGEAIVYEYLKQKQANKEISNLTWYNENKLESGLPYDFSFQDHAGNLIYLDVKATSYTFDQKMIFSDKEILRNAKIAISPMNDDFQFSHNIAV